MAIGFLFAIYPEIPIGDVTIYSCGPLYFFVAFIMAEVITVAKDSETGEEMVVYKCTGNHGQTNHTDGVYVRSMKMFLSEVDHEKYPDVKTKYRFTKVVR